MSASLFHNRFSLQAIQNLYQTAFAGVCFPQASQVLIPLRLFILFGHDLSRFTKEFYRFLVGTGLDLGDQSFRLVFPDGHRPIRRMGLNRGGDGVFINPEPSKMAFGTLIVPFQHLVGLFLKNSDVNQIADQGKSNPLIRIRPGQAGFRQGPAFLCPGQLTFFQVAQ